MKKQTISEEFKRMQKLAGLINENQESNLLTIDKYLTKLIPYVTNPDLFKNNFNVWESALFSNDYNEAIENEFIEANEISEEEFNKLHNELNNNYDFNYFVRNWTVLDDEQSRYEDEKGKDVEYFKTTYGVNDEIANVMKKIIDTFI